MDERVIGYWHADWPITPDLVDRDKPILSRLTEAINAAEAKSPVAIELEGLTVYVEGRRWEWRVERTP